MSEDTDAGKAMNGHIFISHVYDDPDWPQAQIEAIADAIRSSGMAVRMERWKQPEGARFPSIDAWKTWLDEVVIDAERIVCLVSPRYEKCWKERTNGTVEGLALEGVSVVSFSNQDRSAARGRLITVLQENRDSSVVPKDFSDFLYFQWPKDRDEFIARLLGKKDPWHVEETLRILEDAMSAMLQTSEKITFSKVHVLGELDAEEMSADVYAPDVPIGPEHDAAGSHVFDDSGETSIVVEAQAISHASVSTPRIEIVAAPEVVQRRELHRASTDNSGMWPVEDAWRAPVGDFPPPWASAWGDDVYGLWADLTVNSVTQRMRWIEPSGPEGFWMGSTKTERAAIEYEAVRNWANGSEHEPTRVVIAKGFWLADTPCTQAFWQAVTGKNPSHFSKGSEAPERPVENVSWDDVDKHFIKRFAQTPEWGTDDRLCLPTEEEWEYAARAGTRSAYWWGNDWDDAYGNASGKIGATTPVKQFPANPWGLHDVHGNVWEWCSNPWRPRRDAPEVRLNEDACVARGGSWIIHPGHARAGYRFGILRGDVDLHQGFRFALRSPAGPEAR